MHMKKELILYFSVYLRKTSCIDTRRKERHLLFTRYVY